jgi:hypothetical protein
VGPPSPERAAQPGNLGDRAGAEAVEHLDRDLARLRWSGVVDGAQLLTALPGHIHLSCGIAGIEASADFCLLLLGEVLHAVAQQPADLIKLVVFVAAVAQGLLLHATPDLDHLRAQPDHVKGIEHRDRVRKAVVDCAPVCAIASCEVFQMHHIIQNSHERRGFSTSTGGRYGQYRLSPT